MGKVLLRKLGEYDRKVVEASKEKVIEIKPSLASEISNMFKYGRSYHGWLKQQEREAEDAVAL